MLPGTTAVLSLQSPPGTFLCPLASRLASLGSFPPWQSPKGQSSASVSELLPLLHTHVCRMGRGQSKAHCWDHGCLLSGGSQTSIRTLGP